MCDGWMSGRSRSWISNEFRRLRFRSKVFERLGRQWSKSNKDTRKLRTRSTSMLLKVWQENGWTKLS